MRDADTPTLTPELIRRAKAGDRAAWSELYEATNLEIYRTIRSMVPSEDLTLDIQQDVYVRAFTHLDQLENEDRALPWLRSIAVNLTKNTLRRREPVLFTDLEGEEDFQPELPDPSPEGLPEQALDRKETARLVREVLSVLTPGQQLLVGMYYYEQIPVKQIAQELGVSDGAVRTQLSRGRKRVEQEVRRLEDRGVKLYGLSPMAYLLALLRRQEPAAEAGKTVLTGALTKTTGLRAAGAAGVRVASGFLHTALGRASVALLAAAVVGTGIWGAGEYRRYRQNHPDRDLPSITERLDLLELNPDFDESKENLIPLPPKDTETPTLPETPEDLDPTEPTETATLPETPEDLDPTDPTEAPSPTQTPTPSEPAPTEPGPVTVVEGPAPGGAAPVTPSTDPIVAPTPADPDPDLDIQPTPPATDPAIAAPLPEESTAPRETTASRLTYCRIFGQASGTVRDIRPGNGGYAEAWVEGDAPPTLYTDNPAVVRIGPRQQLYGYGDVDAVPHYGWDLESLGSGTAHIYCELNGEIVRTVTLENPEHPLSLQAVNFSFWTYNAGEGSVEAVNIGNDDELWVEICGEGSTEVYTDDPSVLKVTFINYGPGTNWYESYTRWKIEAVGYGTANVIVKLGDEVVKTIAVPVPEYPRSVLRFEWVHKDIETYGVGAENWIDLLVEGSEKPEVYSDRPDVAEIRYWSGYSGIDTVGRVGGYHIVVRALSPGEANIICKYDGQEIYRLPMTVQPQP